MFKKISIFFASVAVISLGVFSSSVFASHGENLDFCPQGQEFGDTTHTRCVPLGSGISRDTSTGEDSFGRNADFDADCKDQNLSKDNCGIVAYLVLAINVLSAVAGMVIVGSIIFAGYQYMTARDNAGEVTKAKFRILWAMVALGMFIFTYAILNFLVPGGVI